MIKIEELLQLMVERGASDLHLTVGVPPQIRIDEKLVPTEYEVLTPESCRELVYSMLSESRIKRFEQEKELDFSFGLEGLGRFRVNVFMQKGFVAAAIRLIPFKIGTFEELGLPRVVRKLVKLQKGLVLVTGATGSGKSTTLAAMIDAINEERPCHIITIEDPIEYVHPHKKAIVNQREVGADTYSFNNALKYVLREDPDVILIGEMRDLETIKAALTSAETINRIIDVFPSHQQEQVRVQLSFVLQAIIAQQLIPRADGKGRVLAAEVLVATPAVRALIRENKVHQIYSIMQTSAQLGMQTMNQALAVLYQRHLITYEDALSRSLDPEELRRILKQSSSGVTAGV